MADYRLLIKGQDGKFDCFWMRQLLEKSWEEGLIDYEIIGVYNWNIKLGNIIFTTILSRLGRFNIHVIVGENIIEIYDYEEGWLCSENKKVVRDILGLINKLCDVITKKTDEEENKQKRKEKEIQDLERRRYLAGQKLLDNFELGIRLKK